jgi:hypothetical protein
MFTLRVIEPSGIETVKEVKGVMLRPGIETITGSPCLTYWPAGDNSIPVDVCEGDAYLMNDNGKTVADYCLGHIQRTPAVEETEKN